MKSLILLLAVVSPLFSSPGSAAVGPTQEGTGAQVSRFGNHIPSSGRMPLFNAFQKFCLNTGVRPEAIEKAVAMSGIRVQRRGPTSTTSPMPMDVTSWTMDFEGHSITLNMGHATEPYGRAMVRKSTACSIVSWNRDENASIAALHRWAGITPSTDRRRGPTLYSFETRGAAMIALKKDDAGRLAIAQGRAWHLSITGDSVMLTHFDPPTPRI